MEDSIISKFGDFLRSAGLECARRDGPAAINSFTEIQYAGKIINVLLRRDSGRWDIWFSSPAESPTMWYGLKIVTAIFAEPEQRGISIVERVNYVERNWPKIIQSFSKANLDKTLQLLRSAIADARKEIAERMPGPIQGFESFLAIQGYKVSFRRKPRFPNDSMIICYASSEMNVRISSQRWRVEFSRSGKSTDVWIDFRNVRKGLQWPVDKAVSFVEMFEFMKTHWEEIVKLFTVPEDSDVWRRLLAIRSESLNGEMNMADGYLGK